MARCVALPVSTTLVDPGHARREAAPSTTPSDDEQAAHAPTRRGP